MTDETISKVLRSTSGLQCVDKGGGGNCLFLSIASQISAADVSRAKSKFLADTARLWNDSTLVERAKLLRYVAIQNEELFFDEMRDYTSNPDSLPDHLRWRMREMFKDMAEEFLSSGESQMFPATPGFQVRPIHLRVRALLADTGDAEMFKFVLEHGRRYMEITGQEGNWAGSSEVIALACATARSFQCYGSDLVERDEVELRRVGDQVEVLPYLHAEVPNSANRNAVMMFQCNGGGHYQMLEYCG